MMAQFVEFLTQQQKKIIHMGLMKDPKAHVLTMHDGKGSSNQKSKQKQRSYYIKSQKRRDIPNPSRILQVPKILQIPKGRRRRESNAHIAIN